MIELEPGVYRFLLRGRVVRIQASRGQRVGRILKAGVKDRKATVQVAILESKRKNGAYEIAIKLHAPEQVFYLAANPGASRSDYVTNPSRAAREANGTAIEAVGLGDFLEQRAREAYERDSELRRQRSAQKPPANPRRKRYSVASSLPVKRVERGSLGTTRL